MELLTLRVLERGIRVGCQEPSTQALLTVAYGSMQDDGGMTDLDYTVGRGGTPAAFFVKRSGLEPLTAPDDGTFLALFDGDIAIELQKLRRDLYFVHAAVLSCADMAVMLVATSGGGKSTLCWALSHYGFSYLSDELGPVDLETLDVHPYPRALALKATPPASYPLPPRTVRTSRTLHVTAAEIPGGISRSAAHLSAVFFLDYRPGALEPSVRRVTAGEAVARLYANALNPLAHPGDGLDGAIRIATGSRCFELATADLTRTCALLRATMGLV